MKSSRSFPLPDDLRSKMLKIAAERWMRRTSSQKPGSPAEACAGSTMVVWGGGAIADGAFVLIELDHAIQV